MKKLILSDILPARLYEPVRDEMRRAVVALKKHRRFSVGEHVTIVFENRATMIFQVQEMVRAEQLVEPAKIQAELDVYNELLPSHDELSVTLFVEITDPAKVREVLHTLVGLDAHVALAIAGERVPARFEEGRSEEERIASVQYLRFTLGDKARAALRTPGTPVAVVIDHPRYAARVDLDEEARASLAADLD